MTWSNAENNQMDANGNLISPNGTGQIITDNTKIHIGHQNSFENKYEVDFSNKAGLLQEQHNDLFTNPGTFQIEPANENISHEFENKNYNDGMQNVSSYAYSQDRSIAANTYINPSTDNLSGYISAVNAQTGVESTICTYGATTQSNPNGVDWEYNVDADQMGEKELDDWDFDTTDEVEANMGEVSDAVEPSTDDG